MKIEQVLIRSSSVSFSSTSWISVSWDRTLSNGGVNARIIVKGVVIILMMREDLIELAVKTPFVMIASDAVPYASGAHPRSAGTFARVLGTTCASAVRLI